MKTPQFYILATRNVNDVEFVNFFEFDQWKRIRKALIKCRDMLVKESNKICSEHPLHEAMTLPCGKLVLVPDTKLIKPVFDRLVESEFYSVKIDKIKFNHITFIADFINQKLRSECRYYFMGKYEHELSVRKWPEGVPDVKVDVYDQLDANWDLFAAIVLKNIGVAE